MCLPAGSPQVTQCHSWLQLSTEDREKILDINKAKPKASLRPIEMDSDLKTESRMSLTETQKSEIDRKGHIQESDNSSDTTRNINTRDTVEKDNLDSTKTATAGDIERIKLVVKDNAFVSANGITIEENTELSSDIRSLMDHLVSKEKVSKADSDEGSNTKGLINAACKTILTVVNIEDGERENGIKPNDIDMVSDCHKGHPELSSSDLGHLKFCNDPKPRVVKEGSEVLILGSVLIGKRPHWLQGEIKDTLELITVTNRDINKAVGITIHNSIFVNYWAERCSLEIQETVTVVIDEALMEALASVVTNEDTETSEKSSIHEKYGVALDPEVDENSII